MTLFNYNFQKYLYKNSYCRGQIRLNLTMVTKIIYNYNSIKPYHLCCRIKGVPVDNTTLYLLNDKGQIVEPGCLGELYVAGANLASGYVNNRDPHRFVKNCQPHNQGNNISS